MGTGENRTYREGEEPLEYLHQLMSTRAHPSFDAQFFRALLKEHVPLSGGGSAWHVFNARLRFYRQSLRQLGHRGISNYSYAWDRKLFFLWSRLVARWHDILLETEVTVEMLGFVQSDPPSIYL